MLDLKDRLLKKIQETKNSDLLAEIYRMLEFDINSQDIEVYKLSKDQKSSISEAQNQIKKGDFLADEEANKEVEEWLRKR